MLEELLLNHPTPDDGGGCDWTVDTNPKEVSPESELAVSNTFRRV